MGASLPRGCQGLEANVLATLSIVLVSSWPGAAPPGYLLSARMPKQWKQWQTLFSWVPKSLWIVTAAMKLKDAMTNLDSV